MSIIIKFPYKSTQKKYYQNAFSLFAFFAKNTYTSTTLASLAFCLAVSNFLFEYEMNIFFYYLFFCDQIESNWDVIHQYIDIKILECLESNRKQFSYS